MKISITKKPFAALFALASTLALLVAGAAQATTYVPPGLINPAGSSAGQVIISGGGSTAPGWGPVALSGVTGTLATANGGTGVTSLTANNVLIGNGASLAFAAPGAANSILTSTGASSAPTFQTPSGIFNSLCSSTVGQVWVRMTGGFGCTALGYANPVWWGADPTGSTDSSSAFISALAASAHVLWPPGTFKLASGNITYTFPNATTSLSIDGAGSAVTYLNFTANGGLVFTYDGELNTLHVRNMSIETTVANNSSPGISLVQSVNVANPANTALSDITNVTFTGQTGFGSTDYWSYDFSDSGVSNINFTNDLFAGGNDTGVGVWIYGTTSNIPVVFNFQGCTFITLEVGFYYGSNTQGVTISQSNFTGNDVGIYSDSGEVTLDQLYVGASQFNNFQENILLSTGIDNLMLIGNLFIVQPTLNSIYLTLAEDTTIVGNTFVPQGNTDSNTGIAIVGYTTGATIITGNSFDRMTVGINMSSGAEYVNIQSNVYQGTTTKVSNGCTVGCTVGGGSE